MFVFPSQLTHIIPSRERERKKERLFYRRRFTNLSSVFSREIKKSWGFFSHTGPVRQKLFFKKNMGQYRLLFVVIFVLFTTTFQRQKDWVLFTLLFKFKVNNAKQRCCAWDSSPGPQDGWHRRIHWAVVALFWQSLFPVGESERTSEAERGQ